MSNQSYQARKRKWKGEKGPRHVRLYHWMTDSPAWRSLTALDRAMYIEMAKRYVGEGTNNGQIPY